MKFLSRGVFLGWLALSGVMTVTGCVPFKQARVAAVALTMQDVARSAARQPDPTLIREGSPAYLMLIDGLLESMPNNKDLLSAACQAYNSYASSFLTDEQHASLAEMLFKKAKTYGFRSLSVLSGTDFAQAVSGDPEAFEAVLEKFKKKDVPELFWTTSAWANWIGINPGGVDALSELPMLEATMKRILALDDTFYYGGPHLLLAVTLAAKPSIMGGDLEKSKEEFDRAFALGADKILMSRVYFAQYYAREIKDRSLFVNTLQKVLASPVDTVPDLTLTNVIAKEKAERLLSKTAEYFEESP